METRIFSGQLCSDMEIKDRVYSTDHPFLQVGLHKVAILFLQLASVVSLQLLPNPFQSNKVSKSNLPVTCLVGKSKLFEELLRIFSGSGQAS